MIDVWKHAVRSVCDGRPTALVVVVDHTGSVPGTTGATMVVSDSDSVGTVGGGVAEHRMIERARGYQGPPELVTMVHTPKGAGSLCSGHHTLAMVSLGNDDLPTLEAINHTLDADEVGTLNITDAGISFEPQRISAQEFRQAGDAWWFADNIGRLDTLYVVGGGHVALALSRVMAILPFRIVVLDNRPDLPTMKANEFAHETRVIDYDDVGEHIPGGDRSWVAIMTFGHTNDAAVLRNLLGKPLRYLGLMGSAAKVKQMFGEFREEGIPAEQLDRVSAPIGISIGSHTPEEIAISIAAEIIQARNRSD